MSNLFGLIVNLIYPGDELPIMTGTMGMVWWTIRVNRSVEPQTYRLSIFRAGILAEPTGLQGLVDNSYPTLKGATVALRVWRLANLAEP